MYNTHVIRFNFLPVDFSFQLPSIPQGVYLEIVL